MTARFTLIVFACIFVAFGLPIAGQAAQNNITVYRCVDAKGKLSLRDTPCPKGQTQQARILPKIANSPKPKAAPTIEPAAAAAPPPQVIVINNTPPQPMYECITPDGQTYPSDSPEGNPRWAPLWTIGYPVEVERTIITPGGGHLRYSNGRIDGGWRTGDIHRVVEPTIAGYGAGTWVRDQCHALPQAEVCGRLMDRRDALRTRFFNAMPSERERITREERGINARLAADCGY